MNIDANEADQRHPDGMITVERRSNLLLMGIDRIEKRNSFTPRMHRALQAAYNTLDQDDELRVGVVFGHGGHFTAGLDLPKFVELIRNKESPLDRSGIDPWGRWNRCRKPIISAVSGITYTAGVELMLAGDIVIAASDCRFSQLEPKRGIMPTGGAVHRFIQRGGWGNAMYHLLTCDVFGADEASRIGLVQEVVEPGTEIDRAIEIAEAIAANAPLAVQATIAHGLAYLQEGERTAVDALPTMQERLLGTQDAKEGVDAFKERREPRFLGR